MIYDEKKVREDLLKMTPEERVKYLEKLSHDAKKEMQETEKLLKQSEELLQKNRNDMIQQAILDEQKMLREQEEKKKFEEQRQELTKFFEQEQQGLEANVQDAPRLPESHKMVGVYNRLQELKETEHDSVYMHNTVQELRKEAVDILNHYKQMPEGMREIADATYRLSKELLGENAIDTKKYFP
jgi:hypothetical protein